MQENLSLRDKIEYVISRDGARSAARMLMGGVLGASITGLGDSGWMVAGAATLGIVGLTAIAHIAIERARQRVLADVYREEIGVTLGKSPGAVTRADLPEMARTPDQGGRGSYAIKEALDYFSRTRNFHILSQTITACIMIGGLLAVAALAPQVAPWVLGGGAALLYNEVYNTVLSVGTLFGGSTKDSDGTITKDVRDIESQLALGARISSTRILGLFAKANPDLAADIKARFGKEYNGLGVAEKREAVQAYNERYSLYATDHELNLGIIKPTELAFLAYNQRSGVPPRADAPLPFVDLDALPPQKVARLRSTEQSQRQRWAQSFDPDTQDSCCALVSASPSNDALSSQADDDRRLFSAERDRYRQLTNPFPNR